MGQKRRPQPTRMPEKLLKIRTLLGLSQEQMAERLKHIPSPPQPGTISRIETGKREPSLVLLLEISRIAGLPMEYLVDDKLDIPDRLGRKKS